MKGKAPSMRVTTMQSMTGLRPLVEAARTRTSISRRATSNQTIHGTHLSTRSINESSSLLCQRLRMVRRESRRCLGQSKEASRLQTQESRRVRVRPWCLEWSRLLSHNKFRRRTSCRRLASCLQYECEELMPSPPPCFFALALSRACYLLLYYLGLGLLNQILHCVDYAAALGMDDL